VHGTRVLQVGHGIIMADRMAQSGALRADVTTTLADYGDGQVNREHTTGTGHKGTRVLQVGHNIIMVDMISSSSREKIGRVGDLSNGIQSPYFLAVIPTSMNYDR
jgi:hypothetical protein